MEVDAQAKDSRITEIEANSPAPEAWALFTRLHTSLISYAQLHACSSHLQHWGFSPDTLAVRHQALGAHSTSRAMWWGTGLLSSSREAQPKALATSGLDQRSTVKTPGEGNQQNPKWGSAVRKIPLEKLEGKGCNTLRALLCILIFKKNLEEAIKKGCTVHVYLIRNYC